jgi:hypothetical protein
VALAFAREAVAIAQRIEDAWRAAAARDLRIIERAAEDEDELQALLGRTNIELEATRAALAREQQETAQLREDKRQRWQAHPEKNEAEKVRSLRVRGGGARVPLRARSLKTTP